MIQDIEKEIKLPGYQMSSWKKFHSELSSETDRELHIKYTDLTGYNAKRLLGDLKSDIKRASSKRMKDYLKRKESEIIKARDMYIKEQKRINSMKEHEAQFYENYDENNWAEFEDNYSEDSMP